MFRAKRTAITRTQTIIVVIVLVLAVVAGEIALSKSSGSGPREIDLSIIEDNPVMQIDHFYPDNIYVTPGENITLAIQNGDDETRVFTLTQFNINLTIVTGTAQRVTLTANTLGNFSFISPITAPSAASGQLKGPCLEGFFYVTQNATLLSTTTISGTGVAPGEAQVTAANAGPVGSCTAHPLTVASPP